MAQPSMVVRVAANLADLKKNLAEGKDQIEAVRAGFTKLATSFQGDKLIQQAHNVAAAVQSVGGASKLTEAEQARVNKTVEAAIAKYAALGKEAPSALRQLADETRKVDNESQKWSQRLNGALTGAVAGMSAAVTNLAIDLARAAVQGFGEFIRRGGEVSGMRRGFEALAGGVEQADERVKLMRRSTHGLIDDFSIMQASNKGMLLGLGLNAQQMAELANTATVLGRAMGQDATKSLDDLITALGRSSPMILDNLGLTVKVGEANEAYARTLGKTASDLTDAEKKQAFMNAAMDAAQDKVRTLGDVSLTASDQISRLWTSLKNVTDAGASWVVNLGAVKGALAEVNDKLSLWDSLLRGGPKEALETYKRITGETIPEVNELAKTMGFQSEAAKALTMSETEMENISKKLTESVKAKVEATEKADKAAKQFNESIRSMSRGFEQLKPAIDDAGMSLRNIANGLEGNGTLMTRSLRETAQLNAELVKFANDSGGVFAPSIKSSMESATASTGGFFSKIKGMFGVGGAEGGGTSLSSVLGAVGPGFAAAFMGPGSAGDKLKAFATQAAGTLMGMIPGVGPWLQAFSGPIVEGLTKLASRAKDILSGIFGGPSGTEREQRSLVQAFEQDLANGLTATQRLEAGGEAWKETVIRIRDAYLAQGRSAAEAEADVKRLWESSKQGAGATAQVIADIKTKMDNAAAAGESFADRVTDALDNIPRDIDIRINGNYEQNGGPEGFATGSGGIRDFGRGTLVMLHGRERVQTEAQMKAEQQSGGGDISGAIEVLRDMIKYELPLAMRDALAGVP